MREFGVWNALLEVRVHIWRKLQLFVIGILHFFFSSDHQWIQLPLATATASTVALHTNTNNSGITTGITGRTVPSAAAASRVKKNTTLKKRTKQILFIRHAESEWNEVFNRGAYWQRAISFGRAVVREWLMLPTADSIFIDSPLSRRGQLQAKSLSEDACAHSSPVEQHSAEDHMLRYLCCPLPKSMVVSSNLRRSIDTARIVSAARLELPGEQIHVLSCLQEIGRNIDTLTISDAYKLSPQTLSDTLVEGKAQEELFNLRESHGNKSLLGSGQDRLRLFAKWCFAQNKHDVLIIYGHSHWFRAFCREYFPPDVIHDAKINKLRNCGVVSFCFEEYNGMQYAIRPESFKILR